MISSISRIMVLTKRNLKEILRDSISLFFIIVLPLVMEVLFYLLFHGSTIQFDMKYLAPGIVVFSQSFLALFVGFLISQDNATSFSTRLYVSKAKSYEFIVSYALVLIPIVFLQSILFFSIGIIFDTSLLKIELIYSVLLALITSLLFLGLGILLGTVCNERSVGGVSSIIISAYSILSGMWFPKEGLNEGLVTIMNYLPFKNALMLIQNALNGINNMYNDFVYPLLLVLVYIIIIFALAIFLYKRKMKKS